MPEQDPLMHQTYAVYNTGVEPAMRDVFQLSQGVEESLTEEELPEVGRESIIRSHYEHDDLKKYFVLRVLLAIAKDEKLE